MQQSSAEAKTTLQEFSERLAVLAANRDAQHVDVVTQKHDYVSRFSSAFPIFQQTSTGDSGIGLKDIPLPSVPHNSVGPQQPEGQTTDRHYNTTLSSTTSSGSAHEPTNMTMFRVTSSLPPTRHGGMHHQLSESIVSSSGPRYRLFV